MGTGREKVTTGRWVCREKVGTGRGKVGMLCMRAGREKVGSVFDMFMHRRGNSPCRSHALTLLAL